MPSKFVEYCFDFLAKRARGLGLLRTIVARQKKGKRQEVHLLFSMHDYLSLLKEFEEAQAAKKKAEKETAGMIHALELEMKKHCVTA